MDISRLQLSKQILVIGDIMLDTYFTGDVNRISPEAPVPVFKKTGEHSVLGGASNVAANLAAANQTVSILSIVGNDIAGDKLERILQEHGINTRLLLRTDRSTTVKTRFLASNHQQVMRLDVEETKEITKEESCVLLENLAASIHQFDLLVISDYMKGLLTRNFTQGIIQLANTYRVPVVVDVKDTACAKYAGAFLLKPNLQELHALTGLPVSTDGEIVTAAEVLIETCRCEYVLVTCGGRGMVLIGGMKPYWVKAVSKAVFDVTGAGDTAIAYLSACIVNGMSIEQAVNIATFAASVQVGKVGTSSVYLHEVEIAMNSPTANNTKKLIGAQEILAFREAHRDEIIVFTNGCFDLLHVGHIRYLEQAKKLGDILVVGLNSDASVKRLKGENRPINKQQDRAEVLCALDCIDYVVVFNEDTPYNLIQSIQPDVLTKGGDYLPNEVVGKDVVEARGGKLVLLPFVDGQSTTAIIDRMSHQEENKND